VLQYLPIGGTVGVILLVELIFFAATIWRVAPDVANTLGAPTPPIAEVTNTAALGQLLYTDYLLLFQLAGLVLLVAMVVAIVLTLRAREGVRRQAIATQIARRRELSVEVRKVPTRGGVQW
jgi:NADH-quinone oxidoreductase subunit J